MQPDSEARLRHARDAAELISQLVQGKSWSNYTDHAMLRAAVERQFRIIGEALKQSGRLDRDNAPPESDLLRMIELGNILGHVPARLVDDVLWEAATRRLSPLVEQINYIIHEAPE
jgi:uncharacterized protein with HEPN domain